MPSLCRVSLYFTFTLNRMQVFRSCFTTVFIFKRCRESEIPQSFPTGHAALGLERPRAVPAGRAALARAPAARHGPRGHGVRARRAPSLARGRASGYREVLQLHVQARRDVSFLDGRVDPGSQTLQSRVDDGCLRRDLFRSRHECPARRRGFERDR